MAATGKQVDGWIARARKNGATHVISVCDTFDWSDYPVYVMPDDDLEKTKAKYDGINMQRINEVITVSSAEDEEFENTKSLVAQCVADIRKHRAEMDSTMTTLSRARRTCKHRYVFTGFDTTYSYAQCLACLDTVRWEHGLPPEQFMTAGQRPNLPEAGEPATPPDGKFYAVPGPENYMA